MGVEKVFGLEAWSWARFGREERGIGGAASSTEGVVAGLCGVCGRASVGLFMPKSSAERLGGVGLAGALFAFGFGSEGTTWPSTVSNFAALPLENPCWVAEVDNAVPFLFGVLRVTGSAWLSTGSAVEVLAAENPFCVAGVGRCSGTLSFLPERALLGDDCRETRAGRGLSAARGFSDAFGRRGRGVVGS